jgi:hypothetical protein
MINMCSSSSSSTTLEDKKKTKEKKSFCNCARRKQKERCKRCRIHPVTTLLP